MVFGCVGGVVKTFAEELCVVAVGGEVARLWSPS